MIHTLNYKYIYKIVYLMAWFLTLSNVCICVLSIIDWYPSIFTQNKIAKSFVSFHAQETITHYPVYIGNLDLTIPALNVKQSRQVWLTFRPLPAILKTLHTCIRASTCHLSMTLYLRKWTYVACVTICTISIVYIHFSFRYGWGKIVRFSHIYVFVRMWTFHLPEENNYTAQKTSRQLFRK